MEQFTSKHAQGVIGLLSGWDRIVFRGTYRILSVTKGMMEYLWRTSVRLCDFTEHAKAMTATLLEASLAQAEREGRPIQYLPSSATDKEAEARKILEEHPVDRGLVGLLTCVEPCLTFEVHRNRAAKKLELRAKWGKCLHLYHYYLDPCFGLMNARIETTINQSREFKVYRTSERNPGGDKKWLPMRKGIADLHRRAQVSQKANERYLDALAQLDSTVRLEELLAPVSRPTRRNGKTVRALRLWTAEDQALLEAINRPEFLLAGFRNRDLAQILYPGAQTNPLI